MPALRRLASTGISACLLATLLATVGAPAAAAAGIVVTTLADTAADDGLCSLREAIDAANGNAASGASAGECAAGSGADVITFDVAGTITLAASLPALSGDLTLDGGRAITIDGDGNRLLESSQATTVTLRDLTLAGGAAGNGGAILNGATMSLNRLAITGNTATTLGGAIVAAAGTTTTIRDSTISGNSAATGGALYAGPGSTVAITGSTFSGNTAGNGGAIWSDGSVSIANSTVAGNTASSAGGGVDASSGSLALRHVTLTDNGAGTGGGGLELDASAVVTVANSIVAGNSAPANANVEGPIDATTASLVGGSVAGILDPAGLTDNGGPTRTIDLLPTATSAIDRADAAVCAAGPVDGVDQRGRARPSGAGCDIGAVERDTVAPAGTGTPVAKLVAGESMRGTRARARLAWSPATDPGGSGVGGYVVERQVDGGPFSPLATPTTSSLPIILARDRDYTYRVAPLDRDGNRGAWTISAPVRVALTQQTYAGITFRKRWRTSTDARYSGGSVRRAMVRKASATFLFIGRGIAFVSSTGGTRGKARIYINGRYRATNDLRGPASYRVQAWRKAWTTSATRTIKVVVLGTSGRPRVDVDAFIVLR